MFAGCMPYPKGTPAASPILTRAITCAECSRRHARWRRRPSRDVRTFSRSTRARSRVPPSDSVFEEIGRARRQVTVQHPTSRVGRAHGGLGARCPASGGFILFDGEHRGDHTPSDAHPKRRCRTAISMAAPDGTASFVQDTQALLVQQRQAPLLLSRTSQQCTRQQHAHGHRHQREALGSLWSAVRKLDAHLTRRRCPVCPASRVFVGGATRFV